MSDARAPFLRRLSDERGQSISEYVTLTGLVVSVSLLVVNVLGLSIRHALQSVAEQILKVVTGYP